MKRFLALLLLPIACHAATWTAADTTLAAVQTAYDSASNGDSVIIPSGTSSWTTGLTVTKNISIIGAGIGQTIITNNVPFNPGATTVFQLSVQTNTNLMRLSGMTIQPGLTGPKNDSQAIIYVSGVSTVPNFRIDHINMPNGYAHYIDFHGGLMGVVDHCNFDTDHFQGCLYPYHENWKGVGNWGDNSWADDPHFGTEQAIFIEDCTFDHFDAATMLDGVGGCRVVVRNNIIRRSNMGNHGTDTTGRMRGGRMFEVYNNQFLGDFPTPPGGSSEYASRVVYFRSGTGVVWGNTITYYNIIAQLACYRKWGAGVFPIADGRSSWDSNDATLYASGTHTGTNGTTTLTDSTKTWTANQWVGYSLINLDATGGEQEGCEIISNTATTIETFTGAGFVRVLFDTGDHYAIRKVNIVLDQPARGKGDLISGTFSGNDIAPVAWPNQAREPIYIWGNTWTDRGNGTPAVSLQNLQVWTAGVDYFYSTDNTEAMPGYTPYTYPHPLVSGTGGGDTTPPVISNVAVSAITDHTVTITWTTDEASDSQVNYGTTTSYGTDTTLNASLVTSHSQGLTGLTTDTLYHFRVRSTDAFGNLALSGDSTFPTQPPTLPDPTVSEYLILVK